MKQQIYLLLFMLTINVGRSHSYGHGVKGSFSKSYSSSSASASSSAFSNSYSSGPDALELDDANNAIKSGSGAFSSSFASAGANGGSAKAGSGAVAGSGSFGGSASGSGSGSFSGSGSSHFGGSGSQSQAGSYSGSPSGAISGSGSNYGIGSHSGSAGSHNAGIGQVPVSVSGSGASSGSGSYISGAGIHNVGPGLVPGSGNVQAGQANSGSYSENGKISGVIPQVSGAGCGGSSGCSLPGIQISGSGAIEGYGVQGQGPKPIKVIQATGANGYEGASGNNIRLNVNTTPNKVFINDFQIPEDFAPKTQNHQFPGPQGSIHESKPVTPGQKNPETYNYGQSASNANSFANEESFKAGSCKNCKGPFPGPKGNINDYKPAPQGGGGPPAWVPEEQTAQPPLVRPPIDFSQFPGSTGNINDGKPVTPGDKIPVGVIPVFVGGPYSNQGPQPNPTHQQEVPQPKPGTIAVSVIGKLPGPTGSIHTSVAVGQGTYQPKDKPVIPQVPVSTKPNTYDHKPVPSPDLIHSFPGKPGNIHDSTPVSGAGCANGQCNYQPQPHPQSYPHGQPQPYPGNGPNNNKPGYPDCTHGECDEFGGRLGCHGNSCFGPGKKPSTSHSGSESNAQANSNSKNEDGNIYVDFNHPKPSDYKPDCSRGQCNVDGVYRPDQPQPGTPGRICSGSQCLNDVPQVNIPVAVSPYPENSQPSIPGRICSGSQCLNNVPQVNIPVAVSPHPEKPLPSIPGRVCSGSQCLNNVPQVNIPVAVSPHPEKPHPSIPGKVCSGSQCLNNVPQVNIPVAVSPHPIIPVHEDHKPNPEYPDLDFNINVRNKPDRPDKIQPGCSGSYCGQAPHDNIKPINTEHPKQPSNGYHHTGSNSNANADNFNNQEKIDVQIDQQPDRIIPNDIPIEVDLAKNHSTEQPLIKETPNTKPKPQEVKPGGSMDFLLPGNKPYQHHHVKPHHPKPSHDSQPHHPKPSHDSQPHPLPGSIYYECTGDSCKLPRPEESPNYKPGDSRPDYKPGGSQPDYKPGGSQPNYKPDSPQPGSSPSNYKPSGSQPDHKLGGSQPNYKPGGSQPNYKPGGSQQDYQPDNYKPDDSHPDLPQGNERVYYSCTGSSCPLPHPIPNQPQPGKPGCQGSQCGAGGKDRLFPPPFVSSNNDNGPSAPPSAVPVVIGGEPRPGNQPNGFGGQHSGSGSQANAGSNIYKENLDGDIARPGTGHLPVEQEGQILSGSKPGCSTGTCQLIPGLNSQGYVSGNVVVQKTDGQQIPVIDVHIPNNHPGQPCHGGKCTFPNQPIPGGYFGGNIGAHSGVQPCARGNCGTPSQGGSSGGYSGGFSGSNSGAYSGNSGQAPCGNGNCGHGIHAVNFGGSAQHDHSKIKGGCKTCAQIPIDGSGYSGSGAVSGSSSFSGASSGSFGGSSAGSFSSAGSAAGPEGGLIALKELLNQSLKHSGLQGGIPGPFGGSGSLSHSGASSSGYGSSSAFSGAYSSSGSTSY